MVVLQAGIFVVRSAAESVEDFDRAVGFIGAAPEGVDRDVVDDGPIRAVVADYVGAFDPSIIGLTGDLDDIIEVGRSMAIAVDEGEKLPSGGYEVTHGTQVLAIDEADRTPVYWSSDVSQAQLAHDVTMLLDEG